jgi:creatinine amidohydrolase
MGEGLPCTHHRAVRKDDTTVPEFAKLTSPQIGDLVARKALCLLPVGQVEEHGAHLATGADTMIAERTVLAAAEALHPEPPTVTLPAIWTGYSGRELARWPGTIRVRTRVVADLVFDVITSLTEMGFERIIVVNGHGHHPGILEMVAREVADATGVYISVAQVASLAAAAVREHRKSAPGGCIHGGEFETSLLMRFGEPVDLDKLTDRDVFRFESRHFPKDGFSGSKAAFWSTWGIQKSETGIYGDPTCATEEFGRIVFEAMVAGLVDFAREYHRTPQVKWD